MKFENSGTQLKKVANVIIVVYLICIFISEITSLFMLDAHSDEQILMAIFSAIIAFALNALVGVISYLLLLAFGELVEDVGILRWHFVRNNENVQRSEKPNTMADGQPAGASAIAPGYVKYGNVVVKAASAGTEQSAKDHWICPRCGKENGMDWSSCPKCGSRKE